MHTFKDANGKEWSIHLDVTVTRKIRSSTNVDLHMLDKDSITRLTTNDETLVDVLYVICEDQIKAEGLDAKGFACCLIGETLDDACDALMSEVVFITRRNRKQVVATAWEKTKAAEEKLTGKQMQVLNSGVIEKKAEEAMQELDTLLGNL